MGMKVFTERDVPLLALGYVPAGIAARFGDYHLSTVHRAVAAGRLAGQRVGRRLYVDWESFRRYLGPLGAELPATPAAAVEAVSC